MKMRKREESMVDEYFENCRILAEREREERARAFQTSPEGQKALEAAKKLDLSKYLACTPESTPVPKDDQLKEFLTKNFPPVEYGKAGLEFDSFDRLYWVRKNGNRQSTAKLVDGTIMVERSSDQAETVAALKASGLVETIPGKYALP